MFPKNSALIVLAIVVLAVLAVVACGASPAPAQPIVQPVAPAVQAQAKNYFIKDSAPGWLYVECTKNDGRCGSTLNDALVEIGSKYDVILQVVPIVGAAGYTATYAEQVKVGGKK